MIADFREMLPEGFDEKSRVWVYQSNRMFTLGEALQIEEIINNFISTWNSHGTPVKGYGNLFYGQFIVLIADETAYGVSGCSTDSSVRIIKDVEKMFNVNMFDRMTLAFLIKEKIQTLPMAQLQYALNNNFIEPSTVYFNNTVLNLRELKNNWMIPVKESWLAKKIMTTENN
ncbi:MAG: hypothetical protein J7497_03365 [Chitinophagaceae bacterium]|nr:hypothetical protein [Chitinophagaceae bacterium]